ncbi:hypothetical protein [Halomonas sp. 3H]|uniref:hypothetical protein n=1 Tax=Halomonas sp. 3H TaxID=2952527 RepID=UPI0020B841A6|nr:hypothetical protein [Halomonas sp. 3H]
MSLIRDKVIGMIHDIHPFYQRHKTWLSPIKELVLCVAPIKRLRDAAIDGYGYGADRKKVDVSMTLHDKNAEVAVPLLIEKTSVALMPVTFEDAILFYREQVRYDDLKVAVECFSQWLEQNHERLSGRLLVEYLESLSFSLRSLNGRTISKVPNVNLSHLRSAKNSRRAYLTYFAALVDNLELDRAEKLLNSAVNPNPSLLFQAAVVLQRKPTRVELDATRRLVLREGVLSMLDANLRELGVPENIIALIGASAREDVKRFVFVSQNILEAVSHDALPGEREASLAPIFKFIARRLISLDRTDLANMLLEWLRPLLPEGVIDDLETRIAIQKLSSDAAYNYLKKAADHSPTARNLLGAYAWDRNDFSMARKLAEQPLSDSHSVPLRRQVAQKSTVDRLRFLEQTSEIIRREEQPAQPVGYVLLASLNCFNTLAMVTPALIELKRRGYAVGSLMKGVLDQRPPSETDPSIANLFNSLDRAREDGELVFDWQVDWQNRKVIAEGVNFYQGIYENLSNVYRRASITIDEEPVASTFEIILRRCDYVLRACQLLEHAALKTGQPIVLLGSNSHVAPYSIFRDFALDRRLPNLRYVVASVAYENYYTNLGSKTSGSMAVVDMTLHRNCRAPFLAIPDRFEHWYNDHRDSPDVQNRFDELMAKNRTGSGNSVHSSPMANILSEARNEGRRIVCCFGKILCDLAVPYDGGPAHSDMLDWVRHSIKVARDNPDLLLLIKPHPHELRPEIALELTEKLEDIIPKDLTDNVIVLNHAEFNAGDLAQYLDLAVLWNGTACLELTGLGVPVVMCSHFGRHDYPIPLVYPESKSDYEYLLTSAMLVSPDQELRKKAMGLLHYMGTKEVAIPNLYSRRPITNDSIGVPSWYMDKVNDFVASGDPYMDLAADRITEGVQA